MHGHLLADIGKAILAAGILGIPSFFLGIPLILAYLLAGVLLGPHLGFALIEDASSIATLSEIGLVLLLFILGLEINLPKLMKTGNSVLVSGLGQILGCFGLGYLYFSWLSNGQGDYTTLYLSVAGALSSTLIVVKVLSDKMDLDSLPSRVTLGVLVLQDLFAVGFLALQPNLNNLQFISLVISVSKVGVLVFISWVLARFVLPRVFKLVGSQPELMLILAMSWCFAMCGIADYLQLSLEMGALIAGISIASFPYHLDVAAKVSSLRDFFITLFFVSLGLQIPMPNTEILKLAAIVVLFVLTSRLLTVYPILHRLGMANRASLLPALNLSQLSEFSLVLATLGVTYGHISKDVLSAFILALVVSALISSFLITGAHNIYKKVNPLLEKLGFHDHISQDAREKDLEGYRGESSVVILGFYREGSSLLYEMQARYSPDFLKKILVVDFNPEVHQELKKMNIHCHYGDISSVDTLRHLQLFSAKIIICTISDKILKGTTNLKLLKTLKQIAPESMLIMTADNFATARELYAEGAAFVYISRMQEAPVIIDIIESLQMDGPEGVRSNGLEAIKDRHEIIT